MSSPTETKDVLLSASAYMKKNHPAFDKFYGTGHMTDITAIFSKESESNIILTGKNGVGKTTQVLAITQMQERLKQARADGLSGNKILETDFIKSSITYPLLRNDYYFLDTEILFNTEDKIEIERTLNAVFDTLENASKGSEDGQGKMPVLVIEDMDLLMTTLNRFHLRSPAIRLSAALSNNDFKAIMMVKDVPGKNRANDLMSVIPHGHSLFTTLAVNESDENTTSAILRETREHLTNRYLGVTLSDAAEAEILNLSNKFQTSPYFTTAQPARSLDLRAAIVANFYAQELLEPKEIRLTKAQIKDLEAQDNLSDEQENTLETLTLELETLTNEHNMRLARDIHRQMGASQFDEAILKAQEDVARESEKIITTLKTKQENIVKAQVNNSGQFAEIKDIKERAEATEAFIKEAVDNYTPSEEEFEQNKTVQYSSAKKAIAQLRKEKETQDQKTYAKYDKYRHQPVTIDASDVREIFTALTGIDAKNNDRKAREMLSKLGQSVKDRIIGQDRAVDKIVTAIQTAEAFKKKKRTKPVVSMFGIGPSGVGKSELTKVIAEETGRPLVKIMMQDYKSDSGVSTLLGADAGLVGYEDGGILTESLKKNPNAVLLIDEIEKAHPSVLDALMNILDEGTVNDKKGNVIDCTNVIIVATSNLMAEIFNEDGMTIPKAEETITNAILSGNTDVKPELLNRFDFLSCLDYLEDDSMLTIAKLVAGGTIKEMAEENIELIIADETYKNIIDTLYDRRNGARKVAKLLKDRLKDAFTPIYLQESIKPDYDEDKGLRIAIGFDTNTAELTVNIIEDEPRAPKNVPVRRQPPAKLQMTG